MTKHFFLGGNDLEMEAIRRLLRHKRIPDERIHDKHLDWGARASDYADEIRALGKGDTPVLLELENDLELKPPRAVLLDHHGEQAGIDKPTVLEQLWKLLEMPPSAWGKGEFDDFPLIVANDRGYIPAMRSMGASDKEIADIRRRDRAAQGITPTQEEQAEQALADKRIEANGRLIVVELPHDRIAPVTDRLALESGYDNLLVISPHEVNFSGDGAIVSCLNRHFPGGWYGGELPRQGYWGMGQGEISAREVESFLTSTLTKKAQ